MNLALISSLFFWSFSSMALPSFQEMPLSHFLCTIDSKVENSSEAKFDLALATLVPIFIFNFKRIKSNEKN